MEKKNRDFLIGVCVNLVIAVVIAAVLFGSLFSMGTILTGGKNKAIYQGNTSEARVTLMINVYWGTEYLEGMLKVFERYNVKTTFFVGGSWVAGNNDMLKAIYAAGHEIGSHGYLHKDHKNLTLKQNEDEIAVTGRLVEQLTGVKMNLFAPPSGSMGDNMFTACDTLGYKVIMWSKDTIDWRDKDADITFRRATKEVKNGDLILMHPTKHTLDALPKILQYYKDNGFKAVTVGENLSPSVT